MSDPEIVCVEESTKADFMTGQRMEHIQNELSEPCPYNCQYAHHEPSVGLSECTNDGTGECPTFDGDKAEEKYELIFHPMRYTYSKPLATKP